jgi:hypothetical protein
MMAKYFFTLASLASLLGFGLAIPPFPIPRIRPTVQQLLDQGVIDQKLPAIPLAVKSPYLSTWIKAGSDGGNGGLLAGNWPIHWS